MLFNKFIDDIAPLEMQRSLRELEEAEQVMSAADHILFWIDQMRLHRGTPVAEKNAGNIVHMKRSLYLTALSFNDKRPKIFYSVPGLERLFYEEPTHERRIHLFHDMMSCYMAFADMGGRITPLITYDTEVDNMAADLKAKKEALHDFILRNNLPKRYLQRNFGGRGLVWFSRISEVLEVLDLKEPNRARIGEIISRASQVGRAFVMDIERLASIYDVDIASIRAKEEKIHKKWRIEAQKSEKFVEDKPYKTLPRTHRIAAVWGLIDRLGLRKTKDKTTLAAFVEAVTGGNIEARPQDTVAYKKTEQSAEKAAAEWLKKIDIE